MYAELYFARFSIYFHAEALMKSNATKLRTEITKEERNVAIQVKKSFKSILNDLENAVKVIYKLKTALVKENPNDKKLTKVYKGRLLQYRKNITKVFNPILEDIKKTLEMFDYILDPEIEKLRDVIISEMDEISDIIESFMDLLGEPEKEQFVKKIEYLCSRMENRLNIFMGIVEDQLFGHITHDILGRIKISKLKTNIQKRTRLLNIWINEG